MDLGVFQYKRKWGAAVTVRSRMKRRIWIKLQHNTPAVHQFMKDNPCILIDEQQQLYGLIVTDTPKTAIAKNEVEWRKRYQNPGLRGLLVRSPDDFFEKQTCITKVDSATSITF
jgi:hypothetical protein